MKLKSIFHNSYLEVIDQYDSGIIDNYWFCSAISEKETNISHELFMFAQDYYGYDFWSPMRNDNET